jgi:hypothetical protein
MKLFWFSAQVRPTLRSLVHSGRYELALGLCLALLALAGCGKSAWGVLSHNEYACAAQTPEEITNAKSRFETAVRLFQAAGLRPVAIHLPDGSSNVILTKPGTEARLNLVFPDTGLAAITLVYKSEATEAAAKSEAELLLARAQSLLAPEQTTPRAAN